MTDAELTVMTVDELAARLKLPRSTVVGLCARGDIPGARKLGRQWRIPSTALAAIFEPVAVHAPKPEPRPVPESVARLGPTAAPTRGGARPERSADERKAARRAFLAQLPKAASRGGR